MTYRETCVYLILCFRGSNLRWRLVSVRTYLYLRHYSTTYEANHSTRNAAVVGRIRFKADILYKQAPLSHNSMTLLFVAVKFSHS